MGTMVLQYTYVITCESHHGKSGEHAHLTETKSFGDGFL